MKKIASIVIWSLVAFGILTTPLPARAADPWSSQDVILQAAVQGSLFLDYLQTRQIAKNPERYHETNPIMGRHPSKRTVAAYFAAVSVAHVGIVHFLPKEVRPYFQGLTLIIEVKTVTSNLNIGLGFRW